MIGNIDNVGLEKANTASTQDSREPRLIRVYTEDIVHRVANHYQVERWSTAAR